MKFRAPSTSTISSSAEASVNNVATEIPKHVQQPARPKARPSTSKAQTNKVSRARNTTGKRPRSGSAAKKLNAAMAVKKENVTRKVKHRDNALCYVYVGNISPATDEDTLFKIFKPCGSISNIQIRCSGGLAMTTGKPPPGYYLNHTVRQYAIVMFSKSQHARKALRLHGTIVDDNELVVALSAAELPEVKEKVEKRLREYRERLGGGQARGPLRNTKRPVKLEPTLLIPMVEEPEAGPSSPRKLAAPGRAKIWGFSFALTVV